MAKYTPGPWEWEVNKDDRSFPDNAGPTLIGPNDEKIVSPWCAQDIPHLCVNDWDNSEGSDADEPSPNARLIASAPEIFEALELWFSVACEHIHESCEGIEKTRALIAKVKGEQHGPRA